MTLTLRKPANSKPDDVNLMVMNTRIACRFEDGYRQELAVRAVTGIHLSMRLYTLVNAVGTSYKDNSDYQRVSRQSFHHPALDKGLSLFDEQMIRARQMSPERYYQERIVAISNGHEEIQLGGGVTTEDITQVLPSRGCPYTLDRAAVLVGRC